MGKDVRMIDMAARRNNIMDSVRDYGKQLFGFIRSRVNTDEDAEDILQDVWYQFSNQPEIEAIDSVRGWLYRVARNKIIDRSRKKKTESLEDRMTGDDGELVIPDIMTAAANTPEENELRELFWEEFYAALEELPEKQRNVFLKNEMEDMTLQQIADQEGENIKTIISRKRYAVLHLRERLEYIYTELLND